MSSEVDAYHVVTLTLEQVATLHQALRVRDHERHERGCDLNLKYLQPPEPPWPACLACEQVPERIIFQDERIRPGLEIGFDPCGHRFRATEADMQRLWEMT